MTTNLDPQQTIATLQQRAQGSPYKVTPTQDGAQVEYNVADERWATIFAQNGLNEQFTIDVRLDPAKGTYTAGQTLREVEWRAGVNPGTFVPEFKGNASVQKGTVYKFEKRRTAAVAPDGSVGGPNFTFSTGEMKQFVNDTLSQQGWKKTMDSNTKIGLIAAAGGIGLALLICLVLVILALTGALS